jgi:hypothetical protein
VSLLSPEMKEARSIFAVQESVTTSCMNIRALIPEVHDTWQHALGTRLKISNLLSSGKLNDNVPLRKLAEETVEKLSVIGEEGHDISKMSLEEGVLEMMTNYEKIGNEIQQRHIKILELLNRYVDLDQIGSLAWDELDWESC